MSDFTVGQKYLYEYNRLEIVGQELCAVYSKWVIVSVRDYHRDSAGEIVEVLLNQIYLDSFEEQRLLNRDDSIRDVHRVRPEALVGPLDGPLLAVVQTLLKKKVL